MQLCRMKKRVGLQTTYNIIVDAAPQRTARFLLYFYSVGVHVVDYLCPTSTFYL